MWICSQAQDNYRDSNDSGVQWGVHVDEIREKPHRNSSWIHGYKNSCKTLFPTEIGGGLMFIVPTCTYQYSVANTPSWSIDDSPWVKQLSHDLKNTPWHRKTDFDPGLHVLQQGATQNPQVSDIAGSIGFPDWSSVWFCWLFRHPMYVFQNPVEMLTYKLY